MRTGITQKVPTGDPYIQIVVNSETHTSQGGGGNDRLMKVTTDEQIWGGQYIIELDNSDEALNAKDYKGYPLTLKWGYLTETQSTCSPLWVWSQQMISRDGKLLMVLNCVDIWAFIAAFDTTVANASYNMWWQQATQLDTRVMADGVTLLHDGADGLYHTLLANGDKTIWGILQDMCSSSNLNLTVSKDDDDGYVNSLKPPVSSNNARNLMMSIMDLTKSYLKWKTDGTLGVYQPDLHASVYTFNHLNTFYMEVDEAGVTIPNRVIFWAYDSGTTPPGKAWIYSQYASGYGVDSDSYTRVGRYVDRHYLLSNLDTNVMRSQSELNTYADAALDKIQAERNQGFLVAPMHCSLELMDKITVNDDRYTTDRVVTGYVYRIIREYDRGVYRITIFLGGAAGGYTVPGGVPGKGMAGGGAPEQPSSQGGEYNPPIGYLPYIAAVNFTSVDWDTVSWTAGAVKFGDGSSQTIDLGSFDMTADGAWYFYAIWGNTALQKSQTATDATGDDRVLVAVASRASTTAQKAYVLNPFMDNILINTDKVMDGLVTELKLASEAVTTAKIKVANITEACLAAGAITETKLGANAVTTTKIALDAITNDLIAANAITATEINDNAITSGKILAGAVIAGKIGAGAVTATEIAANTITAAQIATGTITATQIAANTITAANIAANTITASQIASNTITASEIAANSINTSELAADAVTAENIYAGAVTAVKLEATLTLSTIIYAGSATDGVKLSSSGVQVYDSSTEWCQINDTQINIWGKSNALVTRATKTGTIQCYVGSDGAIYAGAGNVKLNYDGIEITGDNKLRFIESSTVRGYISATSIGLKVFSNSRLTLNSTGAMINIASAQDVELSCGSGYGVNMNPTGYLTLPYYNTGSAPSGTFHNGDLVYNFATHSLNLYSDGAWYHWSRLNGWG